MSAVCLSISKPFYSSRASGPRGRPVAARSQARQSVGVGSLTASPAQRRFWRSTCTSTCHVDDGAKASSYVLDGILQHIARTGGKAEKRLT